MTLLILGVIATFSIPKVLNAQSTSAAKASALETAAMIAQSYHAYKLEGSSDAMTDVEDFVHYMNYVATDSTTPVDSVGGTTWGSCGDRLYCLVMHNGGRLFLYGDEFGGTDTTNAIWFEFDPDGKEGGLTSVGFNLYYNGRLDSYGTQDGQSCSGNPPFCYGAESDPGWFSW